MGKKLAKAKAALAEVTNITKDNDAPDWTLTKKEKKKRKEMALADASNVSLESTDELNNKKDKKAKKRKHQEKEDVVDAAETKLDWADEVEAAIPSSPKKK